MTTERALMSKSISTTVEAEGSPYIQENFEPIKVSGFENQNYTGRFNAFSGEIEVKTGDDNVIALDLEANYTVTFTRGGIVYKPYTFYTPNNTKKRGFLVVLRDMDSKAFLKREVIKFYDTEPANSSYQNAKPARFQRDDDEYYILVNNEIKYFPDSKKGLAKAFPAHANGLKALVKSKKLSYKNEADLITMAEYIFNN
jgi:hypothetical protein